MIPRRDELLARLRAQRFDLLIIGGGIVGAGIARDAAMRGLKVALIDQGDFAGGTSSKTSKLIHGGLRYLEQGHLRLVFESLRERQILRTIAPALVHPISLLLPIYCGDARSAWKISIGLRLYDWLAVGRNIQAHHMLSARRACELEPRLQTDGLRAAGLYADCQMDDARVCLANILQAVSFGGVCVNYVRVVELLKADGRLCGASVEDGFTSRSMEVQARVVINATGPWSDQIRRLSDAAAPSRLAPTKGIHVILPRLTKTALFVQARAAQRMFFILPWGEHSLVGTTESAVREPLEVLRANADEVGYLLEEVNRILPGACVTEEQVIATYAGARPLLAFAGTSTQASREHRIEVDRWGLVSVLGGKYTTYRLMAQQVLDALATRHHWSTERCLTDQVSLLESIEPIAMDHWYEVTRAIDPDVLARLLTRYGTHAFHLFRLLARDPSLNQPVCPHHEYIQAELIHAIQQEFACTITDVLARRTRIAWSPCQGLDALSILIDFFQQYAGSSRAQMEQQVEAYHQFLSNGLLFRSAFAAQPEHRVMGA